MFLDDTTTTDNEYKPKWKYVFTKLNNLIETNRNLANVTLAHIFDQKKE